MRWRQPFCDGIRARRQQRCETRLVDRAERDAYLDRVLIGGQEQRRVVIVDYDPGWPVRYESKGERVRLALGAAALRIEHIGSTAVPGLAAKPVIDLLVTVDDPEDDAALVPAMESAGYFLRVREAGHRMFRTSGRDVHIHVWAGSDPEVERYLRFRDQLRQSTEDRLAYEHLKRKLAKRGWADMNDYADAKTELIASILNKAEP